MANSEKSVKYTANTPMPRFFGEKSGEFDFVAFNLPDSRICNSPGVNQSRYICLYQLTTKKKTYEKAEITGTNIC
jgi:hypothetical protein